MPPPTRTLRSTGRCSLGVEAGSRPRAAPTARGLAWSCSEAPRKSATVAGGQGRRSSATLFGEAPSARIQEAGSRDQEDPSRRERYPRALVQHPARYAGAAGAVPEPADPAADGTGRPGADLPAGDHRAGSLGRAVDRDPGPGARDLQDLAAEPCLPGGPAREGARHAGAHLLQI